MNEIDYLRAQMNEQSNLQNEIGDQQTRLYAPQLKEQVDEMKAAVIAQTNPAKALKVLIAGFRGKYINEDNETEQIGEPMMNEVGISRISTAISPYLSDPARFGTVPKEQIRSSSLQIINNLTTDIGINWRKYGMIEASMRDKVLDMLRTLIFFTLTRSEEGNEKNWLGKIVIESIGNQKKPINKGGGTWAEVKEKFRL